MTSKFYASSCKREQKKKIEGRDFEAGLQLFHTRYLKGDEREKKLCSKENTYERERNLCQLLRMNDGFSMSSDKLISVNSVRAFQSLSVQSDIFQKGEKQCE